MKDRRIHKNIHPCAEGEELLPTEEDVTHPTQPIVEHAYDGKIEFNYK